VKIALAQLNPTVGDVTGNCARILETVNDARAAGADLAVFPEQAIIGYPARDLLLRRRLIEANLAALDQIARAATDIAVLLGFAEWNPNPHGRALYNAAALLHRGRVVATSRKRLLPNYDVFDEVRYFEPADEQPVIEFGGIRMGVTICEDMWSEQQDLGSRRIYSCDPLGELAAKGCDLLINISASPYACDKQAERLSLIAGHARRMKLPIVYVNQVGGNDHVLFDGASCAVDAGGEPIALAKCFAEDMLVLDLDQPQAARRETMPFDAAGVREALLMGLRDYVRKCGFQSVVVGVSGGIDSAVVAALAAQALGPDRVLAVGMPSRYSSAHSVADARQLADNLGIRFKLIEIESMHAAVEAALAPAFAGRAADVTEENIQARIRGMTLMALSNKLGALLLSTGNKSELAVGYCTLYGDMCGGLAVISDAPKTMVYTLAAHINDAAGRELIPRNTIAKPPSAELRPDQFDQQALPPYEILDAILERYEERCQSADRIIEAGFDAGTVHEVIRLIRASEYKRQQAAPGLRVTSKAFGFGRRMPIAARVRH
jgi:NAD+ synthetase